MTAQHETERKDGVSREKGEKPVFSKFRPLVASAAILVAACSYEGNGVRPNDGGNGPVDAGHDAGDGGMGGDGGMMDGGDGGTMDGGGGDGGDGGMPSVCPGVSADSLLGMFALNTDVDVGGYHIRFVGQISGGVEYDIRCAADSALLEDDHPFMQGIEGTVLRPQDTAVSVTGMRIRITNSSSNAASSTSNVIVEPAP